jgi:hypothetical protein
LAPAARATAEEVAKLEPLVALAWAAEGAEAREEEEEEEEALRLQSGAALWVAVRVDLRSRKGRRT